MSGATYGNGRIVPAGQAIIEDHLKKTLSMTSGVAWKPYNNKNMPRVNHSVFGDFPQDYLKQAEAAVTDVKPIDKQEVSIAASGNPMLKRGDGLGGKTVSLNKPKAKPIIQKPVAGAVNRRSIPVSEFRLFYDRGDLPVTVEHQAPQNKINWKVDI